LAERRPNVVREIYRLFVDSKRAAAHPPAEGFDMTPFGVEATRAGLDIVIDYAVQQGILPRRISVEEAYEPGLRALGSMV
jgi:4,5-dihydroxyphthalate decarboxylase